MKLYGIPNCNSVKKARIWLESNGIAYQFHDFKKLGIDAQTLQSWLAQLPWERLVNRAGITWRNLSDTEKHAVKDDASAIALMLAKPSVIKRPVVLKADKIMVIGFLESEYKSTFK